LDKVEIPTVATVGLGQHRKKKEIPTVVAVVFVSRVVYRFTTA
jgi:hypothetical protein